MSQGKLFFSGLILSLSLGVFATSPVMAQERAADRDASTPSVAPKEALASSVSGDTKKAKQSWRARMAAARKARAEKKAAAVEKAADREAKLSPQLSEAAREALEARARGIVVPRVIPPLNPSAQIGGANGKPARPALVPALRNVDPIPPPKRNEVTFEEREPVRPYPPNQGTTPDAARQVSYAPTVSAPTLTTGMGFEGIGVGLAGFTPSSNPPDVNGHVGATQFVQWNNTSFAVFNKTTGALQYGPYAGNTLFQSLGGVCASHNDGDPVVNYDILAGRWILSQFAVDGPAGSASHQCVAVSVTNDATGAYYLYDFLTDSTNFVDYPHMAVWSNGYYMPTHVFNAAGTSYVAGRVYAFERDKMLLGQPARQLSIDLPGSPYGFLVSDLDSLTPPPAGAGPFVMGPAGGCSPTGCTDLIVGRINVLWGTTPTIAFDNSGTVQATSWNDAPCINNTAAQNNRDCVPQPSPAVGSDDLDSLSSHFMYRLAYRNHGTGNESLVATETVGSTAFGVNHGALRWYEFAGNFGTAAPVCTRNKGNWVCPWIKQTGTYDPDSSYRWMGSIAMDKDQNIMLGFSKSDASATKPGIYMTGRSVADPAGSMTISPEVVVQAGAGVQLSTAPTGNAGNRWGDYSAMTLDPIDQCTFWYTNEYLKTDGDFNWSTRIASYKVASCTPATATQWGTVTGTITSCLTGAPLSGVVVTLSNGYAGSTNSSGVYSFLAPLGSFTATAASPDRNCGSSSPTTASIVVSASGTTTQNFCMTGDSNIQFVSRTIDDSSGNNNTIINRNECVKLNVVLKNAGCTNESGVSATLSTSTAGVTVTQANSPYPNLAVDASGSNATPFAFETSNSFVCGTPIDFTLTMYYAGGTKTVTFSAPTCAGGANQSFGPYALTTSDLTQSDRLGRDGVPSTCANKFNAAGGFAGTKYYKTFTFTNNSGSATCYTVNLTAGLGGAGDIESAAYSPSYNPAALATNFLGDSGIVGLGTTVGNVSYSFTVPAGQTFVIVVNTTGTTTSSTFSGIVSGFVDTTAGPGVCVVPSPSPLQVLTATSSGNQNVLEWLSPASGSGLSMDVRFRTDTYPTSATDGTAVPGSPVAITAGAAGSLTHSSLVNGTRYYYAAFVKSGASYSPGRSISAVPFSTAGAAKWAYSTGAASLTPPGVGLNAAYTVSNDRLVHSMLFGTGVWPTTPTWLPFAMNAPSQARPGIPTVNFGLAGSKEVLYVGSQDGNVYCLNAATGAQEWKTASPLAPAGSLVQGAVNGVFTTYGSTFNRVFAGTRNSTANNVMYGLNATTGGTDWSFNNGGGVNAIGIITGDPWVDYGPQKLYFTSRAKSGGSSGTLWCVTFAGVACSGYPLSLGDIDGSVTLNNGRIYVGNNTGTVYVLNASTGATLGSFNTNDGPVKGFVSANFFTASAPYDIYFSTTSKVWRLADNGGTSGALSSTWSVPISGPSVPLFDGSSILVGSSNGSLYRLNLANGATVSSVQLGDGTAAVGSPSFDYAHQKYYVGTDGGQVYSVQAPLQ